MVIPAPVREALAEHARDESPNEACGLVVVKGGVAERYVAGVNAAASPYRFELDVPPETWFLEDDGYELAVFHSHLSSPPRPSRTDVENVGLWAGRPYLIYTVRSDELAGWRISDGAHRAARADRGLVAGGQTGGRDRTACEGVVVLARKPTHAQGADTAITLERGDPALEEREEGIEARALRCVGARLLREGRGGGRVAPRRRVCLALGVQARVSSGAVHRGGRDDLAVVVRRVHGHGSRRVLDDESDRFHRLLESHAAILTHLPDRRPLSTMSAP